ncbi:MAG: U32 family peptidase [Clostridia bacterium]|nr:U32 family peptidase [Clostridia bacterium]
MPELLAPAGNFEKLKAALLYRADAVYLGWNRFGMRAAADNFTTEELYAACAYTHDRGKRLYLTTNTLPRGGEYPALEEFFRELASWDAYHRPDALIVADLGVMRLAQRVWPSVEIHVSTQASIISPAAAQAYAELGAKRLVLARELAFDEIRAIREALDPSVELEAFIHGSMCVAFSGRCLLSHHLTGRDANRGACTQPCRWNYKIVEEKRPDEVLPIYEDAEQGTFVLSSKDMCMITEIPRLMQSGIDSFKIEGRMKSAYYTAVVTNAYRMAMDAYERDPQGYTLDPAWYAELCSVSHRDYGTGYYLDDPMKNAQLCTEMGYIREKAYLATALETNEEDIPAPLVSENENGRLYRFVQRNKVSAETVGEIISPGRIGRAFTVSELYTIEGEAIPAAPHPSMEFYLRVPFEVSPGDIMRAGGDV